MHRRSSRNSATTHPDPSLLNQGYTFFPPGSNSYTANMRDVTFGPNASIISGSWGSYVRMDASPIGSMANMDGSDRVNHDRQDGRGLDSSNGEMEAPVCQDGMNDDEPLSDEDFQQAIDPRDHRRSFIPEAISPAARLRVHHENTSTSIHIPRMHEQRNTRTSRTPSLSSHARSNTNASTNPTHSNFFRGASNVQITGTPTFNTIVGGVVVESHAYGPGTIDNLEFGIRFSPSRSSTAHHDSYQSRRSRYDPPSHRRRRTTESQPNIAVSNFRPSTPLFSQDRTRTGTEYSGAPIDPLPPYEMGEDRTLEHMWTWIILALVPLATFWVAERGE